MSSQRKKTPLKYLKLMLSCVLLSCVFALGSLVPLNGVTVNQPTFAYAQESQAFSRSSFSPLLKEHLASLIAARRDNNKELENKEFAVIEKMDPEAARIMHLIFNHWTYVENSFKRNLDGIPKGLPDPSHHAFIVLGYALAPDGTMKPELIGRLEAAYKAYQEYPQAYFIVTGGVPQNGHTEGELMREWLINKGVPADHVFAETKAPDTAGNATNSFNIIYKDLDIKTASVITSGYHLKRGELLLYAESLLRAAELGVKPVDFLPEYNTGWKRDDLEDESIAHRARTLSQILGVVTQYSQLKSPTAPDTITIDGRHDYEKGDKLDVVVIYTDKNGVAHDVTKEAVITGDEVINEGSAGKVTATYQLNGKTYTATFNVSSHGEGWYKNKLSELVDSVEPLQEKDYTPETWKGLQEAYQAAKAAIAGNVDQKAMRTQLDNLSLALYNLVPADKNVADQTTPDEKAQSSQDEAGATDASKAEATTGQSGKTQAKKSQAPMPKTSDATASGIGLASAGFALVAGCAIAKKKSNRAA